jgi:uncharacterized membrane protein
VIEEILLLFAALVTLAVLAALIVLPILALIQFIDLKARLQHLEQEVLGRKARATEFVAEAEAVPAAERAPEHRAKTPPQRHAIPRQGPDWTKLEAWLGVRALGWTAVLLLLLTAAFFLKVLFDRGLVGELARIMMGVAAGIGLTIWGWVCHRRGQRIFCEMLTSGGIVLVYLSTYATFGFYQLLLQHQAAPFLIVLVAEALALAALYQSPAIAVMGVVGGLLNPLLLHTEHDQYVGFFGYLAILNAGVVTLSLFRRWLGVTTITFVGAHGLFWIWFAERYHPDKLDACLVFHLAMFGMYVAQMTAVNVWQNRPANIEELIRILLGAALTSSAGYVLLDDKYHLWMGTFSVALAIVYALLAVVVHRFARTDELLEFILIALAMAFVAAVFPLHADAAWIAVGWAVQGLALWWFGVRVQHKLLYVLGACLLALALGRLLLVDTLARPLHDGPFVPIFNRYGCPATIVAMSLITAAVLQRRTHPDPDRREFTVMRLVGLAGVGVLWLVLSLETYDFFVARGDLASPGVQAALTPAERELPQDALQRLFDERAEDLRLTAQMSLSALWAVYALVLVALGLRLEHRPLRWAGLALFGLTLVKVILIDTARLQGMYRVGAFFALTLMMAAGAWAYHMLRLALHNSEPEKDYEAHN